MYINLYVLRYLGINVTSYVISCCVFFIFVSLVTSPAASSSVFRMLFSVRVFFLSPVQIACCFMSAIMRYKKSGVDDDDDNDDDDDDDLVITPHKCWASDQN